MPVSGHIPDMTSTTENYIELQRVYQEKHVADKMAIQTYVHATLEKLGLPKSKYVVDLGVLLLLLVYVYLLQSIGCSIGCAKHETRRVSMDEMDEFCKHAACIRV